MTTVARLKRNVVVLYSASMLAVGVFRAAGERMSRIISNVGRSMPIEARKALLPPPVAPASFCHQASHQQAHGFKALQIIGRDEIMASMKAGIAGGGILLLL